MSTSSELQVRAVADIHANTVDEMVAVGFDDQLRTVGGDFAEQSAKRCLGAGVEMDFRLLEEVEVGRRRRRISSVTIGNTWLTP